VWQLLSGHDRLCVSSVGGAVVRRQLCGSILGPVFDAGRQLSAGHRQPLQDQSDRYQKFLGGRSVGSVRRRLRRGGMRLVLAERVLRGEIAAR